MKKEGGTMAENNKDYGKLIPGHGGILDRFDSMLFTAPIIYYAVRLWML